MLVKKGRLVRRDRSIGDIDSKILGNFYVSIIDSIDDVIERELRDSDKGRDTRVFEILFACVDVESDGCYGIIACGSYECAEFVVDMWKQALGYYGLSGKLVDVGNSGIIICGEDCSLPCSVCLNCRLVDGALLHHSACDEIEKYIKSDIEIQLEEVP